ncbi:MAG: hypothetical protein N2314_07005 [Brevinematales bacterium]|nr:hypothetical protein [Brevinematales bacterium]
MKKTTLFVVLLLLSFAGCGTKTKSPEKHTLLFQGEAIGIDLMPELAEINLSLTVGMIREGFLVSKKQGTIAIKQLSSSSLSPEEQNRIRTFQVGKWHLAALSYTYTLSLSSPPEKTFEIERWIGANKIKASPLMMILHEGLEQNLSHLSHYTGRGYLERLSYETTPADIKIKLKVVLTPYVGQ